MAKTNAPENFIDIYETPRVVDAPSASGKEPVATEAPAGDADTASESASAEAAPEAQADSTADEGASA